MIKQYLSIIATLIILTNPHSLFVMKRSSGKKKSFSLPQIFRVIKRRRKKTITLPSKHTLTKTLTSIDWDSVPIKMSDLGKGEKTGPRERITSSLAVDLDYTPVRMSDLGRGKRTGLRKKIMPSLEVDLDRASVRMSDLGRRPKRKY